MTDDDLLFEIECKPTPHPDAVASGTCPAPSTDPSPSDTTVSPSSSEDTVGEEPSTMVPEPVNEPSLPITGFPLMGAMLVSFALVAAAFALIALTRKRRKATNW